MFPMDESEISCSALLSLLQQAVWIAGCSAPQRDRLISELCGCLVFRVLQRLLLIWAALRQIRQFTGINNKQFQTLVNW